MTSTPDRDRPLSAFMQAVGLVLDNVQSTHVPGRIDLGARHHQPWRLVHGGVHATAIESAASAGASTAAQEHGLVAVGVNNNTNLLRSMTEGRVTVDARALQQGRTQQLWEARVPDDRDRLIATARSASRTSPRAPDMASLAAPPSSRAFDAITALIAVSEGTQQRTR